MERVALRRAAMERVTMERVAMERVALRRAAMERVTMERVTMERVTMERVALSERSTTSTSINLQQQSDNNTSPPSGNAPNIQPMFRVSSVGHRDYVQVLDSPRDYVQVLDSHRDYVQVLDPRRRAGALQVDEVLWVTEVTALRAAAVNHGGALGVRRVRDDEGRCRDVSGPS
ncbi:hypothetical protein GBF38_001181 [Nibea albiflora]|uniref:Uncharacterized protein n=1 Tax=Nibea albiflora TaxID=240163 RepID=A0ACB7EXB0_NIBAL|nr:hypothetical protein GBF38_001181 [Nibea albiflora]